MDDYASNEEIRHALAKAPTNRSHDDLLLLKSWIVRSEFMLKNLDGIINPQQMNELCKNLELRDYAVDEIVFRQGDNKEENKKVFILLSGRCELFVATKIDLTQGQSEWRDKHVFSYDKRGQYFGERAILFDEARAGTIIAKELTALVSVAKDIYLKVSEPCTVFISRVHHIDDLR